MGGSSRQTTKETQTTTLPGSQQQNVDLLMQGGRDLYASGGPQYFAGQNYTDPTLNQLTGRQMATDYAGGVGQAMVGSAIDANNFWMDPNRVFNLSSIPGYDAARSGITQATTQNLMENILPQLRGAAAGGGNLGGSRAGMMDALAIGRTNEGLGRALADLDLGLYSQNLQANQNAIGRAPQMFQLGVAPADVFNQVGGQERMDAENKLNADKERWDFEQNRMPQLLAMLQALTGTSGQYGGTTTGKSTTKGAGGNGVMQGLGMALSLGSMLYGGGAGAGGIAAGTNATGRLPIGGQMVA